MKNFLWYALPIIFLAVLWEIVSRSELISTVLFPPPSKVILALYFMIKNGTLISDINASLWRVLVGLSLGSLIGVITGLLTGRIKTFSRLFSPIILLFRSFPPVAILPFVIIWLGIDDIAKIFSIAFAVFFPVWANSHIGAQQIPRIFLWSAQLLTKSILKKFYKVIIPAAMPFIIAGIRIGIAVSFIMLFVSEISGASSGLGYRISVSNLAYRVDEMMASLFILGILGMTTDQLFVVITKKIFPWTKNISL